MPRLKPVDFDPFEQVPAPAQASGSTVSRLKPVDFDPFEETGALAGTVESLAGAIPFVGERAAAGVRSFMAPNQTDAAAQAYNQNTGMVERAYNSVRRGAHGFRAGIQAGIATEGFSTADQMEREGSVLAGGVPFDPADPAGAVTTIRQNATAAAAKAAQSNIAQRGIAGNPAVEAINREGGTTGDAVRAFLSDPVGVTAQIGIESAVQFLPALAVTAVTRSPAASMTAAGLNSGAVEYGSSVLDYLGSKQGVDVSDADAVAQALADPTVSAEAIQWAMRRASIIGGVDAATMGLASRVPGVRTFASKGANEAANVFGVQPLIQGIAGGAGEAGAQLATEGEIKNPGAILSEVVGEAAGAPLEAIPFAVDRVREARRRPVTIQTLSPDEQDAVSAMMATADPELADIAAGRPRAGALTGPPAQPGPPAWTVDSQGNVNIPGTGPRMLEARPGASGAAQPGIPNQTGTMFVNQAGVATPAPGIEIAPEADPGLGILEPGPVIRDDRARPPPMARAGVALPQEQARVDPVTGAVIGVPVGREMVPFNPDVPDGTGMAPPASPPPDDNIQDFLDDPETNRLMALDPERHSAEFGLPPAPARPPRGTGWSFPSPKAIEKRIEDMRARGQLNPNKQTVTRSLFNENYHDALDFLALNGGLDRAVWAGVGKKRGEGVDKATFSNAGADDNVRFGISGPRLFPPEGGKTPDQALAALQEAGFLPENPTDRPPEIGTNEVLDLVFDSLGGRRFYTDRAQDVRGTIDAILHQQQEFASLKSQREDEEATAAEIGMSRSGLRDLVRQMESEGEIETSPVFDDGDTMSVVEWARRAEGLGVPLDDVAELFTNWQDAPTFVRGVSKLIQEKGRADTTRPIEDRAQGVRRSRGVEAQGESDASREGESLETRRLRAENETLRHQLETDRLTGTRSREAFQRDKDDQRYTGAVFVDIKHFKGYNTLFGEVGGDLVLKAVGAKMVDLFGGAAYRRGGDEFAILTEQGSERAAELAAELSDTLGAMAFSMRDPNGVAWTITGIPIRYGVGANDEQANLDSARRKANEPAADREALTNVSRATADMARSREDRRAPSDRREEPGRFRVPDSGPAPQNEVTPQTPAPAGVPAPGGLFAPPTPQEAVRAATVAKDDARNSTAAGVSLSGRGDLFGGPVPLQATIPPATPAAGRTAPSGTVTPSTVSAQRAAPKRGLSLIQVEVETTDGDTIKVSADKALKAAEKRMGVLRRLLDCVRA